MRDLSMTLAMTLAPATAMRGSLLLLGAIGGLTVVLGGCAEPARIDLLEGDLQLNLPGAPVNVPPAVVVRDRENKPVKGVEVKFQVSDGGGGLTGGTVKTGKDGVARVGSWVLGEGENRLTATVGYDQVQGNPITIRATGRPSQFTVALEYLTPISEAHQSAFQNAAARWSQLIVGDVPDIVLRDVPAETCGPGSPAITERGFDDIHIYVTVGLIDGPGQILGAAGPCIIRTEGGLPILGVMIFDEEDLGFLAARGQLEATILHEMGHVIGYGALWGRAGLLRSPSLPNQPGADTNFSGQRALAAFNLVGGSAYTAGAKVPVENRLGGSGTRDGHWRESVFRTELMTGILNSSVPNLLSRVSVASLWDLGYQVNLSGADAYGLPTNTSALVAEDAGGIDLGDDILRQPLMVANPEGRIVEVREAR